MLPLPLSSDASVKLDICHYWILNFLFLSASPAKLPAHSPKSRVLLTSLIAIPNIRLIFNNTLSIFYCLSSSGLNPLC